MQEFAFMYVYVYMSLCFYTNVYACMFLLSDVM